MSVSKTKTSSLPPSFLCRNLTSEIRRGRVLDKQGDYKEPLSHPITIENIAENKQRPCPSARFGWVDTLTFSLFFTCAFRCQSPQRKTWPNKEQTEYNFSLLIKKKVKMTEQVNNEQLCSFQCNQLWIMCWILLFVPLDLFSTFI